MENRTPFIGRPCTVCAGTGDTWIAGLGSFVECKKCKGRGLKQVTAARRTGALKPIKLNKQEIAEYKEDLRIVAGETLTYKTDYAGVHFYIDDEYYTDDIYDIYIRVFNTLFPGGNHEE